MLISRTDCKNVEICYSMFQKKTNLIFSHTFNFVAVLFIFRNMAIICYHKIGKFLEYREGDEKQNY